VGLWKAGLVAFAFSWGKLLVRGVGFIVFSNFLLGIFTYSVEAGLGPGALPSSSAGRIIMTALKLSWISGA
jgi:hypothetical protein